MHEGVLDGARISEAYSSVLRGLSEVYKSASLKPLHSLSSVADEAHRPFTGKPLYGNIAPFLVTTPAPLQRISVWVPGGGLMEYVRENPNAGGLGLVSVPLPPPVV